MIELVYYAHAIGDYDTEKEREELDTIELFFPEYSVFNPNCLRIRQANNPMKACLEIIHDESITALVFSEVQFYFQHNRFINQGVYAEAYLAQKLMKPLYLLRDSDIVEFYGKFTQISTKPMRYKVR